ncbi:BREX system ATP-binding domain-containing protein [Halorussus sp. MSC15.2]|uniref:BREX system ATP-binding domain-containing protein n=1 Tax=Halorussus sp. MSC15.2 TaxID=2283638 RepID=UPI0013D0814B|nr:BREX system ATP-binding domain-containing protein [Halorussus sp. MSC15.2]NEU59175.1 ATPase [Halorussus sp. MSC15.2]
MNNSFTISDEQQNYTQYNLQANPFPYSPVPAEDPEIFCGQQHVAEQISSTVSSVLATGKSKHLVVTGKYGNGKSHTLKYTRSLLRDRDDVVVGYVAQPGEGFLDIYHEFMYDLGFNRIQELAYNWLASVARDVTDANPMGAESMRSLIDEGDVLLSDIVPEAIRKLSDITRFADFARAIVHMVYEDTNLYAWQWLTAEGIRYEQRKEMEIHSALDDDTMGVRAFTALKNLLLDLGYTSVFVFVDEFESIARLNSKNEQATLNSIRHLMDQNSSGLCVLFGCAPEVWQDVMSEYHAFSERIGQEVALRPLTSEHLYELVADYLNRERDEPNGEAPIHPFTEESLDMILQRSQGNVRQVLALCSRVLDTAIEDEREVITEEFVQESM